MAKRAKAKSIPVSRPAPTSGARRSSEVVSRVLELVRTGNLRAGDRLPPERELIGIFGLSRPSLREGLRALDSLGVTESRHGDGVFVSNLEARTLLAPLDFYLSLSEVNLEESFDCRRLVEVQAARAATLNAGKKDLDRLEEMMTAHETVAKDSIGFRILDSRFHEFLWSLAGNTMLERICFALYNLGLDIRRQVTEQHREIALSTKEHAVLFEAMKAGDAEAAGNAMKLHLDHVETSTRELLQDPPSGEPAQLS